MNAIEQLEARGFIAQYTHEQEIKELFDKEKVTFYVGFDPTADSLTVGHFIPILAMAHLQRAGHRPIALIGGGTTMVGDPSERSDMRQMLTKEQINANGERFKKQMSRFFDFSDDKAIMANNADWLLNLNYVDFLREIGIHFSVNRMLTADCYKTRMEKGLTFLEFNYMLMQSYDFLELYKRYDCVMQMGGNDQWSNILSGADLIRRKMQKPAFGVTFNLLTTSEGKKMGKTAKGAVWLDPDKTSPYDFFQYFRNVDDADVEKLLKILTFLPLEEIAELAKLEGAEINVAKEKLAYEITALVHGADEADKALQAAKSIFTGSGDDANIPSTEVVKAQLESGLNVLDAFLTAGLIASKGEGRRLIKQNGLSLNGKKIASFDEVITLSDFDDGKCTLQKGKKVFHQLIVN